MDGNPYQVHGSGPHAPFGRHDQLRKLQSRIDKTKPDHVSLVGHRNIGKSVFLQTISNNSALTKSFNACVYWDLKRGAVESDGEFYQRFANVLVQPLTPFDPQIPKWLSGKDGQTFEGISLIFETLKEDSKRVLILLDGLDDLLVGSSLSKNVWDNMRSLMELNSVCLITASRRKPRELVMSADSRSSPMWNMFADTPIRLLPFTEDDWSEILEPFAKRNIQFEQGAVSELSNWTGGIPILVIALCQTLWTESADNATFTNETVNNVAKGAYNDFRDYLETLWNDCPENEKGEFVNLVLAGQLSSASVSGASKNGLRERGLIEESGQTIRPCCRYLQQYAKEYGESSNAIRLLFGTENDYAANIKRAVQLRFEHLEGIDSDLRDFLREAIDNLAKPNKVVYAIRGLVDRVLEIIFSIEHPSGFVPAEWVADWQSYGGDFPTNEVSKDRRQQILLFRMIADERRAGHTTVSRTAGLLLNHLYFVGTYGQHREGDQPPEGFGIATCFAAFELARDISLWAQSAAEVPHKST